MLFKVALALTATGICWAVHDVWAGLPWQGLGILGACVAGTLRLIGAELVDLPRAYLLAAAAVTLGGFILTEFHESARTDRQLFGRCARQGDPGTIESIVSSTDELFRRFAPDAGRWLMGMLIRRNQPSQRSLRWWATYLQGRAERHYRKQRIETMRRDAEWMRALGFVGKTRK